MKPFLSSVDSAYHCALSTA